MSQWTPRLSQLRTRGTPMLVHAPTRQTPVVNIHSVNHILHGSEGSLGRWCNFQINDAIWRVLKCADVPATKEPTVILRGDGMHPDSLIMVPWQSGCSLAWNVTVVDTLANSYRSTTPVTSYRAAEATAALRKRAKYADIIQSHILVPIAI